MNIIGSWYLLKKEVLRFIKVYNQTIISPVITALIYLAIFVLALGYNSNHKINGINFIDFMSCGLIIMTAVQNAFANTSSSLVMSKILGTVIDYRTPPFNSFEVMLALTLGGLARGIIVAALTWLCLYKMVDFRIHNYLYVIFYLFSSSMLLAQLGLLTGLLSKNYEQMSSINSYFITPFSFLSGTFYSINQLPSLLIKISHFNPFFYMIDGFRYGMIGYNDSNLHVGFYVITLSIIILFCVNYLLFERGFATKS